MKKSPRLGEIRGATYENTDSPEAMAGNATDADVKAFAAGTAPTLRHHLEMIRGLAQRLGVPLK